MLAKHQPGTKQMVEELAAMKAEFLAMQWELDKAISTKEDIPSDAAAFITAVTKVDHPLFWDADPVLWFYHSVSAFRSTGTVSSGVKSNHIVGKLPIVLSLSCSSLLPVINFKDKNAYESIIAHLYKNYSKSKWRWVISF